MALSPQFGSIVPSPQQQLLATNYLAFNTGGANANDFAQQYLPEIYEQEVERYGNRTLSGFLRMVGAEMPMTSDQVIWSEQNRLHVSYDNVGNAGANVLVIPVRVAAAGLPAITNVVSPGQTIVAMDGAGQELKCIVTASNTAAPGAAGAGQLTVAPYTCLLYTSPSPRDRQKSRMPSSA